ncbi:WD40 repeat-like protein [Artomyces pyxidatus]|uniref:WD40 repeat-like protein n=1 Tax=Artomyces pyxidatus TaxID=48021 RepID=A0ACB8TKL6_9AGAM|nr:WD40 repeat-like protein [Artomyces pyxidatus]
MWSRRRRTVCRTLSALAMSRPGSFPRQVQLPTRSVLRSFVSSHKADVFVCHSDRTSAFMTPPYACAYTNAAKRGGVPYLAVATEQGTVYIRNTSKRDAWDAEPQRIDLDVHDNGIFDIQWSMSDALFATSAGDHSTRITDPITAKTLHILRGHTSTVKSVVWDPAHENLLSTGGRDGGICVWDLRVEAMEQDDGVPHAISPVLTIKGAHGEDPQSKGRGRKAKTSGSRTVTSLLYPNTDPYGLISGGSFDGILRYWDLRQPTSSGKTKTAKAQGMRPTQMSAFDPTTLHGTRRSHGITSLVCGSGPTAGVLFGLGTDSRIHTYAMPSLLPLSDTPGRAFTHPQMLTNSFYVRLALAPNGRWLASGSTMTGGFGSAFLYDVSQTALAAPTGIAETAGVQLAAQRGEVGAVDWAEGMLATCSDDGSVRIWRTDDEMRRRCDEEDDAHWNWAWAVDQR